MGRGIERTPIFRSAADRADFVTRMISAREGVLESALRSGIRLRAVVRARKLLRPITVTGMGYAGAEVARCLGVTTSSVNRLAVSEELPEVRQHLNAL